MNIVRVPPTSGTNTQSQNKFHLQHNSLFLHWTRGVTLNHSQGGARGPLPGPR